MLRATHLGHDADGVSCGDATADHVQLTVAHKPVFKLYCSEAYQYAHRGTVHRYLMQVERLDGFDGPIHLEVADRQIKDLDGIEVRQMTVGPGETSFMLPLYLPETMHINKQAHSNVYAQAFISFTDKWKQPQTHLVVSTMRCMVRTLPPVVKLNAVSPRLTVPAGGAADCHLELVRTSNFSGPMKIELVATQPEGCCKAAPFTIGEQQTSGTARLETAGAGQGQATLTFRATGIMPGGVEVVSEATVGLDFQ